MFCFTDECFPFVGLGLTLNIGQNDYVKDLGGSAGGQNSRSPSGSDAFPEGRRCLDRPRTNDHHWHSSGELSTHTYARTHAREYTRTHTYKIFRILEMQYPDKKIPCNADKVGWRQLERTGKVKGLRECPSDFDKNVLICLPLQLNVVRLPEPYGNCTDTTERNIKRSVFEEAYPVGYSISVRIQADRILS